MARARATQVARGNRRDGAQTYGRLLRDVARQTGVRRRPSRSTIHAAALRAQALESGPVEEVGEATTLVPVSSRFAAIARATRPADGQGGSGESAGQPVTVGADVLRVTVTPLTRDLLRESIAPVRALLAQQWHPVLHVSARSK